MSMYSQRVYRPPSCAFDRVLAVCSGLDCSREEYLDIYPLVD